MILTGVYNLFYSTGQRDSQLELASSEDFKSFIFKKLINWFTELPLIQLQLIFILICIGLIAL